jgi:hypothetical protein
MENEEKQVNIPGIIGRLLCWLGFHDLQVLETTFGFGEGGNVEKDRCRRCGALFTRRV